MAIAIRRRGKQGGGRRLIAAGGGGAREKREDLVDGTTLLKIRIGLVIYSIWVFG